MCHFEQEDLIVKQLPAFVLPEIQRYAKDDGILDSAQTPVFPRLDALGHAALRISLTSCGIILLWHTDSLAVAWGLSYSAEGGI